MYMIFHKKNKLYIQIFFFYHFFFFFLQGIVPARGIDVEITPSVSNSKVQPARLDQIEIAPQIFVPDLQATSSNQTQNKLWSDDGYNEMFAMIEDADICENNGKIFFYY